MCKMRAKLRGFTRSLQTRMHPVTGKGIMRYLDAECVKYRKQRNTSKANLNPDLNPDT